MVRAVKCCARLRHLCSTSLASAGTTPSPAAADTTSRCAPPKSKPRAGVRSGWRWRPSGLAHHQNRNGDRAGDTGDMPPILSTTLLVSLHLPPKASDVFRSAHAQSGKCAQQEAHACTCLTQDNLLSQSDSTIGMIVMVPLPERLRYWHGDHTSPCELTAGEDR